MISMKHLILWLRFYEPMGLAEDKNTEAVENLSVGQVKKKIVNIEKDLQQMGNLEALIRTELHGSLLGGGIALQVCCATGEGVVRQGIEDQNPGS